MIESGNPLTALMDAIRQGPEPVVGYNDSGERQKAFNFGWNTKAERVWAPAQAVQAQHDALVAALNGMIQAYDGSGGITAEQSLQNYDNARALLGVAQPMTQQAPPVETEDELIAVYEKWNKANGLNLGSADEHLYDERLTCEQRQWLARFCERWDAMLELSGTGETPAKVRP